MKENIRPVLLEELGLRYYLNSNHNFGRFQCPYYSSSFEARISDVKASRIKSCGCLKVKVGTGLTDKDRDKPFNYYTGKVIEIQYNEFIKSKSKSIDSLFLPRFIEVREDKNTATSYEEIVG